MKTYPLYLNGEWFISDDAVPVENPATGKPEAAISTVERPRVAQAIADAHKALSLWRGMTATERAGYLMRIAACLESRAGEIANTITMENGKPIAQSKGEVGMSVDHLRWFAGEARRAYGRLIPQQIPHKRNMVVKTPVGVVGAISPWNFPLVLSVRKVAPALAAGCPVILKPSSKTPLCALALAECVHEAGLPEGVFQMLVGPASHVAREFIENPLCRKVTFTGSSPVGRELIRTAADYVKPLSLELGGHAPVLVFDDVDLDQAVEGVMVAKFRNIGQSCIAANRVYVQRGIYDRFLQRFKQRTEAMKVGPGTDPDVEIGPLIDRTAVDEAHRHVKDALAKGAKLVCGGAPLTGVEGHFFPPTIITEVPDGAVCMREETFAPVAPVAVFDTEEEGIGRANDSDYGLSAYAFTRDVGRVFRLMEALEAGSIGINDGAPTASQAPFGGLKQSGWGRELGTEGMDAFLDTKHVSLGNIS